MAKKQSDQFIISTSDDSLNEIKLDTPLPQPQFTILLLVRFAEPVAFTFLFPFIYEMVKDLKITDDESQIAYYVGWIATSFAFAQVCTTLLWGLLSDRWGRKPCVILGLFGTGTSMLLFGFSKSFAWAVVTRAMSGALNGNVAIVKSMVAELTDASNRAKGFSLLPMMFGIGSIFGPIIGGFLYGPAKYMPSIFGKYQILVDYPSLLPCLVISSLCYICMIFGFFFLEETLPSKKAKLTMYNTIEENRETDALINPHRNNFQNYSQAPSSSSTVVNQANAYNDQESLKSVDTLPSYEWSFSYETKMCILGYTLLSVMSVMIDELFSTWGPTPFEKGGLGYSSHTLAIIQTLAGVMIILTQQFLYAHIAKKFGVLKLYQILYIPYFFVLLCFPFANTIISMYGADSAWYMIAILYFLRSSIGVSLFTSINILMSESAESHMLATVNSIGQTFGSLSRAIGPATIGMIFSWSISAPHIFPFDFHFGWFFVSGFCLICLFAAKMMAKPV